MNDPSAAIRRNVAEIRQRIADAVARSGRAADEITLVAVTKYVEEPAVRAVVEAGCRLLGESRPQQLWDRSERLRDLPVQWHLIGHLQRNKVRKTLPLVRMIESADSLALVEAIGRHAAELDLRVPVLLEVNVAGETAKHGFDPSAVEPVLEQVARHKHVEIRGLMCMAALEGGRDAARRDFAALRTLRDRLRPNCPAPIRLDELSMGMSGDYEAAIEEGATIVRIGSALFEGASP